MTIIIIINITAVYKLWDRCREEAPSYRKERNAVGFIRPQASFITALWPVLWFPLIRRESIRSYYLLTVHDEVTTSKSIPREPTLALKLRASMTIVPSNKTQTRNEPSNWFSCPPCPSPSAPEAAPNYAISRRQMNSPAVWNFLCNV